MKIIMPYGLVRLVTVMLAALLLAACGGGGGGGSDDSIQAAPSTNKLTITPRSVSVSRDGATQTPATLTLTLTTASGAPASGVVTFAVPSSVKVGAKNVPVRIGVDGRATVQVFAKTAGNGAIKTTYTSGGGTSSGPSVKFTSTVTDTSNNGSGTTDSPSLSEIALRDNSGSQIGTAANPITLSSSATVTVTLLQADGSTPIVDAPIVFSLSSGVGILGKTSALTDGSGTATLILMAGTTQGAGTLTASYSDPRSGVDITRSKSFAVTVGSTGGTGPVLSTPELLDASNKPVGTTANPITNEKSARVSVTLTDGGLAVANKLVSFRLTGDVGQLDPVTGTALTDGSGTATITLKAGAKEGAGTLIASYAGGNNTLTSQIDFTTKGAGPVTQLKLALGTVSGTGFTEGTIAAPSNATSGSTYSVTVNVANSSTDELFTDAPVEVTFSSQCAGSSLATFSPKSKNSVGGTVLTSYSPKNGCKKDTITATATVNGDTLTAVTPAFVVTQSLVNTISFVSASPDTIGLKGASAAGVEEASVLTFAVKDQNGTAVGAGVNITFSVQTPAGGFGIAGSSSGTTNGTGEVSVTVNSGSVPMVGTVKAALTSDTSIYGTGSVSVQSGVPTQDGFTLSVGTSNPAAGNHPGTSVDVSVRAADRYGNLVPDGTIIHFATKLGSIKSSCTTTAGSCQVPWTSQGPQPLKFDPQRASAGCANFDATELYRHGLPVQPWQMACGKHDRYGVNVITAWATGEESFSDEDGNNVFDDGESYVDLGEAFVDNNLNGKYDPAAGSFLEDYQDLDSNGAYSGPDGRYNGLSCDSSSSSKCSNSLVNVRSAATMVLSTDDIQMGVWDKLPADLDVSSPTSWGQGATLTSTESQLVQPEPSITVVVVDMNGNAPPTGTKIEVTTSQGEAASVKPKVLGPSDCTVGSTLGPLVCTFNVVMGDASPSASTAGSGTGNSLTITATSGANSNIFKTQVLTVP